MLTVCSGIKAEAFASFIDQAVGVREMEGAN